MNFMMMGAYQMGTPQSNYLTQTKPGGNAYGPQQNYAPQQDYGGYGEVYDLPMPNPYYEANITQYPTNYAPTYAPRSFTPNYQVQMNRPPVYDHPGFKAPYIDIPTPPPLYMPENPQAPLPYQIPPPPKVDIPPVATPLAYAPKIAKPLDFGYAPPVEQAPYVNTPKAPYGPDRPGTPVYPRQQPLNFQRQTNPNYYPLQQKPNFPGAYTQNNYQAPPQMNIPNYGIPYSFGQQGGRHVNNHYQQPQQYGGYQQPQQYGGFQQPQGGSYPSGITSY